MNSQILESFQDTLDLVGGETQNSPGKWLHPKVEAPQLVGSPGWPIQNHRFSLGIGPLLPLVPVATEATSRSERLGPGTDRRWQTWQIGGRWAPGR